MEGKGEEGGATSDGGLAGEGEKREEGAVAGREGGRGRRK